MTPSFGFHPNNQFERHEAARYVDGAPRRVRNSTLLFCPAWLQSRASLLLEPEIWEVHWHALCIGLDLWSMR